MDEEAESIFFFKIFFFNVLNGPVSSVNDFFYYSVFTGPEVQSSKKVTDSGYSHTSRH